MRENLSNELLYSFMEQTAASLSHFEDYVILRELEARNRPKTSR